MTSATLKFHTYSSKLQWWFIIPYPSYTIRSLSYRQVANLDSWRHETLVRLHLTSLWFCTNSRYFCVQSPRCWEMCLFCSLCLTLSHSLWPFYFMRLVSSTHFYQYDRFTLLDISQSWSFKMNSGAPGWHSQLSVWLLVLVQVMISWFMSSNPTSGSALMLQSLLGILCRLLSDPPPLVLSLPLSQNK